jgi:hypothetical protein
MTWSQMTYCLRGARVSLYSLEGPTWALRSNRLEEWRRCTLGRRWRNIPEADRQGPPPGIGRHQGGAGQSHLAASRALHQGVVSWSPLESLKIVFVAVKLSSFWRFDPPFWFSEYTLQKIQIHQNLWKLSVSTPKFVLVIYFKHLFKLCWRFNMVDNYRQQHPLAKDFILMIIQWFPTHLQTSVTNCHICYADIPIVRNATERYIHRPQLHKLCRCVRWWWNVLLCFANSTPWIIGGIILW